MITFTAEIKQINVTKTASNDKEVKIVLITDDSQVLLLQDRIASDTVTVSIE